MFVIHGLLSGKKWIIETVGSLGSFTLAQQITLIDSLKQLKQQEELSRQLGMLRAKGLLGVERTFAGKNTHGEVGLFIRDDKVRVRIKIFSDNQNNPKMLVLDERGRENGTAMPKQLSRGYPKG